MEAEQRVHRGAHGMNALTGGSNDTEDRATRSTILNRSTLLVQHESDVEHVIPCVMLSVMTAIKSTLFPESP